MSILFLSLTAKTSLELSANEGISFKLVYFGGGVAGGQTPTLQEVAV